MESGAANIKQIAYICWWMKKKMCIYTGQQEATGGRRWITKIISLLKDTGGSAGEKLIYAN